MNNPCSYLLATVVSLASLLLSPIVLEQQYRSTTVAASTAHFNPGKTYLFSPAKHQQDQMCY
jgi:hypothetical protein